MPINMLTNPLRTLLASTSRLLAPSTASSSRSASSAAAHLGDLGPAKGATKVDTRYGRGPGSQKGGTSGRGHKGQKARNGKGVRLGFEGGQTPLFRKVPKKGFINFTAKNYAPLSLATLQKYIANSRISPDEPITVGTILQANAVHGLKAQSGVKLLGDVDPELPLPPLTLRLSRYSKSAAKAVIEAGGDVLAVYHNKLALRRQWYPHKFEGRDIKEALPTRRNDILYYTNPDKHGYLAGQAIPSPFKMTPEEWEKIKETKGGSAAAPSA